MIEHMKRTTNILALIIFLAAAWPVTLHAQTKFKDYANQSALSSNALFIISKDDAGGGTRHVSFGQLTNQLGGAFVHNQFAKSASSNLWDLFFWGDSIVAGSDAANTKNYAPLMVRSNLQPMFNLGHSTYTQNGYPGILAGSFPGWGNHEIAGAMLASSNDFTRGGFHVFWGGRNHSWIETFPGYSATNWVVTNNFRMINSLGHSNWIVMAVLVADNELPGSTSFQNITNLNRAQSEIFGDRFYDWWPDLGGDSVNGIPASNFIAGSHVHLTDAALARVATGIVAKVKYVLNKSAMSAPALLTAVQRMSATNPPPTSTNWWNGKLDYRSPAYLSSLTAIDGGNMNFGGTLSGAPAFGLFGFVNGAVAAINQTPYSIHDIPYGGGWTNLTIDRLISTDCDVSGAGGYFTTYVQSWLLNTNGLTTSFVNESAIHQVTALKSNSVYHVKLTCSFTNDYAPRQVRIYYANLSGGNLTNNVYVLSTRAYGSN